jgi:hypothetical protein
LLHFSLFAFLKPLLLLAQNVRDQICHATAAHLDTGGEAAFPLAAKERGPTYIPALAEFFLSEEMRLVKFQWDDLARSNRA